MSNMAAKFSSKFQLPSEWSDEDRMYFLLAPFPEATDPLLSDSKLMFWRSLIKTSSRELGECVFTKGQLCERFKWQEMQPKCLNNVIRAMERLDEVKKLSSYQKNYGGLIGWGVSVVSSPLMWAWSKYVSSQNDDEEEYILVVHVKELAETVFTAHVKEIIHVTTDCLCLYPDFRDKCDTVLNKPSSLCCQAVEFELVRMGLVIISASKENQITVVKLAPNKDQIAVSISDTDFGIVSIKSTLTKLEMQISDKIRDRERLRQKCIEFRDKKQKPRALHFLRLSKCVDSQASQLEKHSENLQEVLSQIEMAETNAEVLKAFQKGNSVLKNLRDEHGLTLEKVEDVMDEVQQVLEEGGEINDAMSKGIRDDNIITDDDDDELLLKELDQLLNQNSATAGAVETLVKEIEGLSLNDDSDKAVKVDTIKNTTICDGAVKEDIQPLKKVKTQTPVVLLS